MPQQQQQISLNEIESLRSQLVKTAGLIESRKSTNTPTPTNQQQPTIRSSPIRKLASASSETTLLPGQNPAHLGLFAPGHDMASSSSSSSSCQWTPNTMLTNTTTPVGDSGVESQRSEATSAAVAARPATKASSIPRPLYNQAGSTGWSTPTPSSSSSSSRSSPLAAHQHPNQTHSRSSGNLASSSSSTAAAANAVLSDEHVYSGYSRDELLQLLKQLGSENVIIKRQLGSKLFNICCFK